MGHLRTQRYTALWDTMGHDKRGQNGILGSFREQYWVSGNTRGYKGTLGNAIGTQGETLRNKGPKGNTKRT